MEIRIWAVLLVLLLAMSLSSAHAKSNRARDRMVEARSVYHLTECTQTALEEAVSVPGRRIRIECSGDIVLDSDLVIQQPGIVLDGTYAPNGGVQIRGGYEVRVMASNVTVRQIRIRPGARPNSIGNSPDALTILAPPGQTIENIVVDHVSLEWGVDGVLDIAGYWGGRVRNVMVTNSIIAEGLHCAYPDQTCHSTGMLIAGDVSNVILTRNLFSDNVNRNPQVSVGDPTGASEGYSEISVLENVFYHQIYGTRLSAMLPDWSLAAEVEGNVYLEGPPDHLGRLPLATLPKVPIEIRGDNVGDVRVALKWNISRLRGSGEPECWNLQTGWSNRPCDDAVIPTEFVASVDIEPDPGALLDEILSDVGATLPCRDALDRRVVDEVRTRSGIWLDQPEEVGGWPDLDLGC